MASTPKPKPNLGKIKKEGQLYQTLDGIAKMPSGHQQLNPYLTYQKQEHNLSDNELDRLKDLILHDTSQVATYLNHYATGHQKNLIKEVSKDPRTVLSKLEESMLVQMAMPHIGDSQYKARKAVLESGESSSIGNVTRTLYQSEAWQLAVSNSSSTALKDTLEKEVARSRKEHMAKDLGWKAGKIDKNKTAGYLALMIKTDEQKLQIGLTYATQK